jgi:hypothetical protein
LLFHFHATQLLENCFSFWFLPEFEPRVFLADVIKILHKSPVNESIPGLLGMNVISACKSLLVQDFGNQYTEEITEIAENFKFKELISSCPIFATRKEKCLLRTVTNVCTTIKEAGKCPVV